MTQRASMKPLALRPLTEGERALGREMFGEGLEPRRIRILCIPVWPRAFAAGARLMVFPVKAAVWDFSQAPLGLQGLFIHELTHVWQAQGGVGLVWAKLRCGDSPAAYAYDLQSGHSFGDLNIEQQAMVVQHAFLASRRGAAPFSALAYGAYLAGFCASKADKPRKL
ncbi:hypothetical protein [Phenylobacterium sp.]|uniref:hypothetical protein n=1 Tax=Phenylobacterium sp. TaxID=1871053 RepID=UPI0027307184|nr:hypothetical protein [Phenylobacterium sp.]MDP2214830.1 hypothetical protein [Phenylobacterium sp.]